MFSPFCLFILSFVTESCYFGFVAKEKAVALLFLYFLPYDITTIQEIK